MYLLYLDFHMILIRKSCCSDRAMYMLRPDSQPLTRFEAGQLFLTRFEAS